MFQDGVGDFVFAFFVGLGADEMNSGELFKLHVGDYQTRTTLELMGLFYKHMYSMSLELMSLFVC